MVPGPRPINGSPGSRVRLILGENGSEWLLLLNNDNGNRKWQVKDWKGIPNPVAKQLNNCTNKERDVKDIDFGPNGEWFINGVKADGSGGHSWWGGTKADELIKELVSTQNRVQASFGSGTSGTETCLIICDDAHSIGHAIGGPLHKKLVKRVKKIYDQEGEINFVRLFNDGQYFISDDDGIEWSLKNNKRCTKELQKSGGNIKEFAYAGDGSWVVIRENNFVASTGVDGELTKKLSKFFSDQRRWINNRSQEIQDVQFAAGLAREERDLAYYQEAREAAERVERERMRREREVEQAAQEAREAAERAERERLAREAMEQETDAATRISSLEAKLAERLLKEAKEIREMEEKLKIRKCSLRDAIRSMPHEVQDRVSIDDNDQGNGSICVVCQDKSAVMAVVPCGHVCLCITCSDAWVDCEADPRLCPLCRGNMRSVLRVYLGSS